MKNILDFKNIIPKEVQVLCEKLENNNQEAWVVGGCVRDFFMDKQPKDWDITTSASYEEIISALSDSVYILPIEGAKEHNVCFVVYNHEKYEIATFRTDVESLDHRHSVTKVTQNIEEDLKRRDFTINAIAFRPQTSELKDLFEGLNDIEKGVIKSVGNPEDRINEDALRILRAYRFSSKFGFDLDEKLKEVCINKANDINYCSKERQREEINKLLSSKINNKESAFNLISLISSNISKKDFYNSVEILNLSPELNISLAILNKNNQNFKEDLKNLNYDNETIKKVSNMIANKDLEFNNSIDIKKFLSNNSLQSFFNLSQFKSLLEQRTLSSVELANRSALLSNIIKNKEPYNFSHLEINGNDLIKSGYKGKEIGEALKSALDIVIENPKMNQKLILESMFKKEIEPGDNW